MTLVNTSSSVSYGQLSLVTEKDCHFPYRDSNAFVVNRLRAVNFGSALEITQLPERPANYRPGEHDSGSLSIIVFPRNYKIKKAYHYVILAISGFIQNAAT